MKHLKFLGSCRLAVLASVVFISSIRAEEGTMSSLAAFESAMRGVTWDMRGTSSLKHLRYDGTSMFAVDAAGERRGGDYDHDMEAPGLFRLNFKGSRSAWYFVREQMDLLISATVKTAIPFSRVIAVGEETAPVAGAFPARIEGQVWAVAVKDAPFRFSWKEGKVVMVDQRSNREEEMVCRVALPGVLEGIDGDGHLLWYVFEPNGVDAWMLEIESMFAGGAAGKVAWPAERPETETGLTSAEEQLVGAVETMLKAGERQMAATLYRDVTRRLERRKDGGAEVLERVKARLGVKD